MSTIMIALDSKSIRYSEFVKITTADTTYTFCSAAAPITVNGITFENLHDLVNISTIQRDIKANSADLQLTISGIDPANIALVLDAGFKGSNLEVWRGFLDDNNQIITTPTQQFFKRYQGIINNVSITEDWNEDMRIRLATIVVSSASMRLVLENRNAGIRTNPSNWKAAYPGDTSMDRVPALASTYFDFGKKPTGGSQSTTTTNKNPSWTQP